MQTLAVASDLPEGRSSSAAAAAPTSAPSRGSPPATTGSASIWLDAHGDLNTPESLAVRQRVGDAAADADRRTARSTRADVALVGRAQPRPAGGRVHRGARDRATTRTPVLERVDAVYVALDLDVLDPGELAVFMPEPDGPTLARGRAAPRAVSPRAARSPAPASPGSRPIPRTWRSSSGSRPRSALGLATALRAQV